MRTVDLPADFDRIRDEIECQLHAVKARGAKAELLEVDDPHSLDGPRLVQAMDAVREVRDRTMREIGAGLMNPQLLREDRAVEAWMRLRKHALALHPIYVAGEHGTLGSGVTPTSLRQCEIGGRPPADILVELIGAERAQARLQAYDHFLTSPYTEWASYLMQGTLDGRAIRTRALAAAGLLGESLSARTAPVTMASLACGAAGPAVDILADLHARGVAVDGLTMLDRDPLALAVASEVTNQRDPGVPVRLLLNDLVDLERFEAIDLAAVLGPESMTAVEMLGLFEYLPDQLAVSLLQHVAAALEPGGLIVFANMLTPRPEQDVFEHVIQWPSLFQRRADQVLDLIEAAGFSPAQTHFVIPEGDLVYQIVLIDTAERRAR